VTPTYLTAHAGSDGPPIVDPTPGTLVYPPERARPGYPPADIPRFGQDRWQLAGLDHKQTARSKPVGWDEFPLPLVGSFKRATWALINIPTPGALFNRQGSNTRALLSAGSIRHTWAAWRRLAAWLFNHRVACLADITADLLVDYARHLHQDGQPSQAQTSRDLAAITRLWAYAPHLPPGDRIVMPPWDAAGGRHDLLGTPTPRAENTTAPVHPAVMSPLLIWALRMVSDFADDIITARHAAQRLRANIPDQRRHDGTAVVRAWLDKLNAAGQPLPGAAQPHLRPRSDRSGKQPARAAPVNITYIAGLLGVHPAQVTSVIRWRRKTHGQLAVAPGAPLITPIGGRLDGKPWTSRIDMEQVASWTVHLSTAAMIVISYLSGMRPEEVLHLRRGCCTRHDDGDVVRYRITGLHFSGVRDEAGNSRPGGEPREQPWTVIAPVATAITVLEQIIDGDLLFPRALSTVTVPTGTHLGHALPWHQTSSRIAAFIDFANTLAHRHGRIHEAIPTDPAGAITLTRLRRTIAWFINRLPGGRIALGIQYGHLRLPMSESYAGRATADLLDLLDLEQARTIADTLTDAADRLDHGEGVSGPAAGRYIAAIDEYRTTYAGGRLTKRQHRALLNNPRLQVFDHEQALLVCNYNPTTALCHPSRHNPRQVNRTPSYDRCQAGCPNIARTDTHIARAQTETDRLAAEIAEGANPQPIRQRLRTRHNALLRIIDNHHANRTTHPGEQQR
jgi:hypothetical protein